MQAIEPVYANVKKVVVIGPECTGKTDLSKFLATHFKTVWVEEYARAYINQLIQPYGQSDLIKIAHGQARMEDEWIREANEVLICDTNALVVKIWSEHKFGECDKEILALTERPYDLYLLTYIDIPWEEDPQREHPDKREHFWATYKNEIEKSEVPFVEIKGSKEERRKIAIEAVQKLLV
ncbi:MAG: ATP-binding protein [Bacteroidia bacterium]|nr:ATP-binding protein [Bacteroidia bacterium]